MENIDYKKLLEWFLGEITTGAFKDIVDTWDERKEILELFRTVEDLDNIEAIKTIARELKYLK